MKPFNPSFELPAASPANEDILNLQMTLLKKLILRLPEAEKRHLISFLSIFYEKSMVAQGHMAMALDRADSAIQSRSTSRCLKNLELLYTNASDALEEIQNLSDLLGEVASTSLDALA